MEGRAEGTHLCLGLGGFGAVWELEQQQPWAPLTCSRADPEGAASPGQERLGSRVWGCSCPEGRAGTHDPRASMKMKVVRMLLVCFFQELLSSSSLRPISSRVEAGDAVRGRRRRGA